MALPGEFQTKDPNALEDYGIDWGKKWLGNDTITTSVWIVAPAGLTTVSTSNTTTTATIWLSGGVVGTTYKATNRITTAAGRINDKTMTIKVIEK